MGTGDFNGDGHEELLWRNADTGVVSWQLNTGPFVDDVVNGDEIQLIRDYGPVTSDWTIAGVGDVTAAFSRALLSRSSYVRTSKMARARTAVLSRDTWTFSGRSLPSKSPGVLSTPSR